MLALADVQQLPTIDLAFQHHSHSLLGNAAFLEIHAQLEVSIFYRIGNIGDLAIG